MNTKDTLSKIAGSLVRPTLVAGLFVVALFVATSPAASAATTVSGTISQDTTWTAAAGPYLVQGSIYVPEGVTLAVGPGTVVKFRDGGSSIAVGGSLVADGTDDERVTFTSYRDDLAGGDTDGVPFTVGAPGDWRHVQFAPGSTGSLSGAVLRYGGRGGYSGDSGACLHVDGGSVALSASSVSSCGWYGASVPSGSLAAAGSSFSSQRLGLYVMGGSASAAGSSFLGNSMYGVYSSAAAAVDARGSWWGSASGPAHASNPGGTGDRVSDNVLFEPFLGSDPTTPGACDPPGPSVSSLAQYDANGDEAAPGAEVRGADLTLSADLASPSGEPVRLEVEMRPASEPFTGEATGMTDYQSYEGTFSVPAKAYLDTDYHWRARAAYEGGAASGWVEFGTEGNADFTQFTRTIRVGVVRVQLQGTPSQTAPVVTPCKLHGYADHVFAARDYLYYSDLAHCTEEYFRDNLYGKIEVEVGFPLGGGAVAVEHDEAYFGGRDGTGGARFTAFKDEMLAAHPQELGAWDTVMFVHSGASTQTPGYYGGTIYNMASYSGTWLAVSEDAPVGVWAHEIGHVVGTKVTGTSVPDLYQDPKRSRMPDNEVGLWDLMSRGDWVDGKTYSRPWNDDGRKGTSPSLMSVFTRRYLGLLADDTIYQGTYQQELVSSLEESWYGGNVKRYVVDENPSDGSSEYYLMEARDGSLSEWGGPQDDPVLVLYHVWEKADSNKSKVQIPGIVKEKNADRPNGVLRVGDKYDDLNRLVRFEAESYDDIDSTRFMRVGIGTVVDSMFGRRYLGSILSPKNPVNLTVSSPGDVSYGEKQAGGVNREPSLGYVASDDYPEILLDAKRSWIVTAVMVGAGVFIVALALRLKKKSDGARAFTGVVLVVLALLMTTARFLYEEQLHLFVSNSLAGAAAVVWLLFLASLFIRKTEVLRRFMLAAAMLLVVPITVSVWLSVVDTRIAASLAPGYYRSMGEGMSDGYDDVYYDAAADDQTALDLDLHVWCDDGRHVGVNYDTGEYEVGVEGAITNGDNVGAPEWIFFPPTPGNASCRHSVSARDNEDFLAANPEIAAQIPDPTDSYDIYARTIDPGTGILTSATLEAQPVMPGETVVHALAVDGTGQPTVAPGVVDATPPTTAASLSGTTGENGWFLGPVTVTLAADDADGSGVASTSYSLDGGLTWNAYSAPFTVADPGTYTLIFGSTDGAGNSEATQSLPFTVAAQSAPFCDQLGQQVTYSPDHFQPEDCDVVAAPGEAVLLDGACQPIAGARVNLRRADGSYVAYAVTGPDGSADLSAHLGGPGSLFEFTHNGSSFRAEAGSLAAGAVAQTAPAALRLVGSGCAPIAGARINLRRADSSYVAYALTDGTGTARFELLPGASMKLEATHNGASWTSAPAAPGTEVTLGAERFALSLLSSSGGPIPGARVNLRRADSSYVAYATTGADGAASFDVLPGAEMRLEATHNGASLVTQPSSAHAPEAVRALPLSLALAGSDGSPIQGARVNLRRADGSYVTYALTGADGAATFDVLPGASMRLEATHNGASWTSDAVTVDAAAALSVQTPPLSLALTGSSGDHIPGARVNLRRADGSYVAYALTGADGVASFDVLPGASMKLEATHNGASFTTGAVTVDEGTSVSVAALPLSLSLAASDGAPIAGARVNLRRADSSYVAYALTNDEGIASFDVLPNAVMKLEAAHNGSSWTSDAVTVDEATALSVRAVPLTVALTSAGQPLAGQRVDLLRADGSYVAYLLTDDSGAATFDALPGAVHRVRSAYGGVTWTSDPAPAPASLSHGF